MKKYGAMKGYPGGYKKLSTIGSGENKSPGPNNGHNVRSAQAGEKLCGTGKRMTPKGTALK